MTNQRLPRRMRARGVCGCCAAGVARSPSSPSPLHERMSPTLPEKCGRQCQNGVSGSEARPIERARQRIAAAAGLIGAVEPVRTSRVAGRRQHVIPECAIADRHFGPGMDIERRGVTMMVVVPLGLWMIVRVGWMTVPAADRITVGCFRLAAASAGLARAAMAARMAATTAMVRMAPRFPVLAL